MFSFYFLSIKCFVDHYKQKEKKIAGSKKWIPRLSLLRLKKLFSRGRKISDKGNATFQGHPTTIFGKISVRKTIWDLEFLEHFFFCKISCLPASPRIFEHLQNTFNNSMFKWFWTIFSLGAPGKSLPFSWINNLLMVLIIMELIICSWFTPNEMVDLYCRN